MITIAIAEDHQALIDGLKLFLQNENDIQVVGEANNGEALIELVKIKRPTVVLTDIRMPKCDGIKATKIIKELFPETKVVCFSMFDQVEAVDQMMEAGASGYLLKNASLVTLLEAIRHVVKFGTYYDYNVILNHHHTKETIILSTREKEILRLVADGKSSQEIADILCIGKNTVDTHRKNIIKKFNIKGKNEFFRFAIERKYDFM